MNKNENKKSNNNEVELNKNENKNSNGNDEETINNFDFTLFEFQNDDDEYEKSEKKNSFVNCDLKESQVANYGGTLINPKEIVNLSISEEDIEYSLANIKKLFISTILNK